MFSRDQQEFGAKTICDLGKALFAIAFASSFFKGFPFYARIILMIICFSFILGSIFLLPVTNKRT